MPRRSSAALVAVALVTSVLLGIAAQAGHATASFAFTRFAGNDRYDTAAKIATGTYTAADTVVVASGETYPDALAGAYAAGLASVPVLLVTRDDVPTPTRSALITLKSTKALIIGGTGAVGTTAEQVLKSLGLATTRISGTSRYDTAAKVATSGGASAVGKTGAVTNGVGGNATAIVVSGEGFADALAGGPLSFGAHLPVLLTPAATLAPEAKAALQTLAIKTVLVLGGTSAVSQAVEDSIKAMNITVTRIAGNDRSETAAKVADYAVASLGFTNTKIDLARGDAFADALAGAVHGGKNATALLLAASSSQVGASTKDWLSAHASTLASGVIDGGTGAISTAAESDATTAGRTTTTTTGPTLPISTTSTTSGGGTTTLLPVPLPIGGATPGPAALSPCLAGQVGAGVPFCFAPAAAPPSAPAFAQAVAVAVTPTLELIYNEPVDCTTVGANAFTINLIAGPSAPLTIQPTASCPGGASSPTVVLDIGGFPGSYFQPGQSGTVTIASGTVKDVNGNAQSAADSVAWALPSPPSTS